MCVCVFEEFENCAYFDVPQTCVVERETNRSSALMLHVNSVVLTSPVHTQSWGFFHSSWIVCTSLSGLFCSQEVCEEMK